MIWCDVLISWMWHGMAVINPSLWLAVVPVILYDRPTPPSLKESRTALLLNAVLLRRISPLRQYNTNCVCVTTTHHITSKSSHHTSIIHVWHFCHNIAHPYHITFVTPHYVYSTHLKHPYKIHITRYHTIIKSCPITSLPYITSHPFLARWCLHHAYSCHITTYHTHITTYHTHVTAYHTHVTTYHNHITTYHTHIPWFSNDIPFILPLYHANHTRITPISQHITLVPSPSHPYGSIAHHCPRHTSLCRTHVTSHSHDIHSTYVTAHHSRAHQRVENFVIFKRLFLTKAVNLSNLFLKRTTKVSLLAP